MALFSGGERAKPESNSKSQIAIHNLTLTHTLEHFYSRYSLGKVIATPEVTRVYIGSFWKEPLKNEDTAPLLEAEMADLLRDLGHLPRLGAVRKINDIVKR